MIAHILAFFRSIFVGSDVDRLRDEYLAQATDLSDLERRMATWNTQRNTFVSPLYEHGG